MQSDPNTVFGFFSNAGNIIAICGLIVACVAAIGPVLVYFNQTKRENLNAVAQFHAQWWSPEFAEYRRIVWDELVKWQKDPVNNPSLLHYSRKGERWGLSDERQIAHSRILFFFSEMNALLEKGMLDEDLTFEIFGVHQYDFFRDYFSAIRSVVKDNSNDGLTPWYVYELGGFDTRLSKWKAGKGAKYNLPSGASG